MAETLRESSEEFLEHARASARYVRISPTKVKPVADLIRERDVSEARAILSLSPRKAARILKKVLDSAVANAENNKDLDREDLYVWKVFVDQGPVMKRWHPRQRGRAFPILKRSSHVTIVVREKGPEWLRRHPKALVKPRRRARAKAKP